MQRVDAMPMAMKDAPAISGGAVARPLLLALWLKRFFVLIPTGAAAFVSFTAVNMIPARYSAETRVYVENRESVYARPMLGERQAAAENIPLDQEAIASHVQLMYSRDLAKDVIRKLKLTTFSEFTAGGAHDFLSAPLLMLGLIKDRTRMTTEERTIDSYYERLKIYPVDKSRVIEVKFELQDALLASKIANAIAERYLEVELQAKLERDRKAGQFIQTRIDDMRKQAEDAEAKVQAFRAKHEIYAAENNQAIGAQQLAELNKELALAQARFAESQAKTKYIREQLNSKKAIELADVLNSTLIQRLIEQRAGIRGEIARTMTSRPPAYPKMRELQAQHADIERQIREEIAKIARGLESDTKLAEVRLNSIKQSIDEMKKVSTAGGTHEVALHALEREAKAQRDLLESWLVMYRDAVARDSLEAHNADGRIVSYAAPASRPAFPKKGPTVLIATFGTLLMAALLVLTRELALSRGVVLHRPQPLALGPPQVDLKNPRSNPRPEVPVAQGFTLDPCHEKTAIADLLYALLGPEAETETPQILYIAGATSSIQEGQFALRLGRALVQAQRRAVIVDVNMPRPQLSLIANNYSGKGLSELLAGKAPFASVIYRDATTRLNIIPFGSAHRDLPSRALTRTSFGKCLNALSATYDFVLLSGPAVAETEEAGDVASLADRVILLGYDSMPEDLVIKARDAFLAAGAAAVDVTMLIDQNPVGRPQGQAAMI